MYKQLLNVLPNSFAYGLNMKKLEPKIHPLNELVSAV